MRKALANNADPSSVEAGTGRTALHKVHKGEANVRRNHACNTDAHAGVKTISADTQLCRCQFPTRYGLRMLLLLLFYRLLESLNRYRSHV